MKYCKVKIIAEAGINHNGQLRKALRMVDVAKNSGADAIKFQIFNAEDVVTPDAKLSNYAIKNMKTVWGSLQTGYYDLRYVFELIMKDLDYLYLDLPKIYLLKLLMIIMIKL